ncbi:MAG: tetratricopeptide repeat protein [Acidimicrobiia bacterium]
MAESRELETALALGEQLVGEERYQQAIDHFKVLAALHPKNPSVLFLLAGAFDSAGLEREAVAPYRAALTSGLSGAEDLRARIQLASTLRNLGENEEAVQILSQVCVQHPEHRAARAFLALALTSAGNPERAVSELLDLLLTHPGPVERYQRSLRWYADHLVA